ncbi:MAG TPA: hypothetical protein VFE18_18745 [Phenylobacterium sp.]|jgi:hypothetical protein|uniref:hypothetical protein n=1 Tax=Phenylobacterium sp. TaxID=1871053 RepID=UPI002D5AE23B|nr:hypothetical protein [Phenylobacterium sp.]HZZ70217.1 hypothetical protein [Phenylobacterium sp.]
MLRRARQLLTACAAAVGVGVASCPALAAPAPSLSPEAAVTAYCEAWSITDRTSRDKALARVWAVDGVYSDPDSYAKGVKGLSDVIADFQRSYAGTHFACSKPQSHHRFMRATWILLRPDGAEVNHGVDFYDMAPGGRIQRIVGFFGPPPAATP